MNDHLQMLSIALIAFGSIAIIALVTDYYIQDEVEQVEAEWVELPITMQYLSGENIMDGVREKIITVGETEIQFTVGVEKGIEETPSPTVLRKLSEAGFYRPYDDSYLYGRMVGSVRLPDGDTEQMDLKEWHLKSLIHRDDQLKKEHIDSTFTCENYQELAWKFKGENMWAAGYGDVEDYIYAKAINECINPTHQEEIDKVYEELKKVNED